MNLPSATCLLCVPGKYAEKGVAACSTCADGKFATASGSTSVAVCMACSESQYSWVNKSQCESCPSNSWSPQLSGFIQNCTCNAGYWAKNLGVDGSACAPCDPGTFKERRGPQACTPIQAGRYSSVQGATTSNVSFACPVNSNSNAGSSFVTDCACNAGYAGILTSTTSTCVACVPGKYRTAGALKSDPCSDCPPNFFSNTTAKTDSACTSCGNYSVSLPGSNSSSMCMCSAGYGLTI